jgi:uncharacterized membrane protein YcaP (DUF421 family)
MELHRIALRALFVFVFLHALLRATGKRAGTQGRSLDLILLLVLGDLIDDAVWAEVPVAQLVVAATTLVTAQVLVAIATCRSATLDRIVSGERDMVVRAGVPLRRTLRGLRMNDGELAEIMRENGLPRPRWDEVRSAWVEPDGRPSVRRHEWARPAQRVDRRRLL